LVGEKGCDPVCQPQAVLGDGESDGGTVLVSTTVGAQIREFERSTPEAEGVPSGALIALMDVDTSKQKMRRNKVSLFFISILHYALTH